MSTLVIGVAGGIGAGKSTFIASLAGTMNAEVVGFGAYVRERAREQSLDPTSREVLQDLGAHLFRELGQREFARRVLGAADKDASVVVDGVRHVEIADALAEAAMPRKFFLVFLDADDSTRRARAGARRNEAEQLAQLAEHSTEQQVHDGSLRARADLVLDASRTISDLVQDTLQHLRPA